MERITVRTGFISILNDKVIRYAVAVFFAAVVPGCTVLPEMDGSDPAREIVEFYRGEMRCPDCSVAYLKRDETAIAGDPRLIYRLGSLSKFFVRAAFERIVADGYIDPGAPVTRYAPFELPEEYDTVTMQDLLDHKSGLPREFLNPWNPLDCHSAFCSGLFGTDLYAGFNEESTFAEALRSDFALRCVKKREQRYSNMGFALLAVSMENALGRTLDGILAREVMGPLGLPDTAFVASGDMRRRLTPPCAGDLPWLLPRGHEVPEHLGDSVLRGTGALFSSAADCAKFFSSQWGYVDSLLVKKKLTAYEDGEMCGLFRVKILPSGKRILYRFGMTYGGASYVCYEPDSRTVLIILRNVTSWPAEEDLIFTDRILSRGEREKAYNITGKAKIK